MYPCSIWGPTCDGLDRIVEQCSLPDMQVGDWLLFENMGAYTVAASSTFNGFQKPDIYYIMSRAAWYVEIVIVHCFFLSMNSTEHSANSLCAGNAVVVIDFLNHVLFQAVHAADLCPGIARRY